MIKKPLDISLLSHFLLDWIDPIITILNIHIICDLIKCGREFSKINFSKEEIDEFNKEFSVEKYSKYWYLFKINYFLGSTGIITWGLISYIIFSRAFIKVIDTYIYTIIIMIIVFYSHSPYKIKNILKNIFNKIYRL